MIPTYFTASLGSGRAVPSTFKLPRVHSFGMRARPAPALVPHSQSAVDLWEGSAGTQRERSRAGKARRAAGRGGAPARPPGARELPGCGFCRGGAPSSALGTDKRPHIPPAGLAPAPERPRWDARHGTARPRTYRAGGESSAPGSSCAPEPQIGRAHV